MPTLSRRTFLMGGASAALLAACGGSSESSGAVLGGAVVDEEKSPPPAATEATRTPTATVTAALPTATPTPSPVPKGTVTRMLLPATAWESAAVIQHSGVAGPAVVVLGGVHGNEPGGWTAAEEVSTWQPAAGTLIVLPRANRLAIDAFERTFPELGDLNRLYPGDPESEFPMERMAAAIMDLCREFKATLLLDMHESWGFYVDYPGTGTSALGQTVTVGVGPLGQAWGEKLIATVNPALPVHDQMLVRDGNRFQRNDATPSPSGTTTNRGRSSLSAGGHVQGLTPVLVEMGQEGQSVRRRVELHHIVARAAFEMVGIL